MFNHLRCTLHTKFQIVHTSMLILSNQWHKHLHFYYNLLQIAYFHRSASTSTMITRDIRQISSLQVIGCCHHLPWSTKKVKGFSSCYHKKEYNVTSPTKYCLCALLQFSICSIQQLTTFNEKSTACRYECTLTSWIVPNQVESSPINVSFNYDNPRHPPEIFLDLIFSTLHSTDVHGCMAFSQIFPMHGHIHLQ